ncbi:MAG TPA: XRE family transcriptional regulator, partial [Armatimonadota bacterium]|nr:XRE family transcriptional regulator [Armatimonadota bacterium]
MRSVKIDAVKLKQLYREQNLTLAALAEIAKVHERTVRNALQGKPVDEETVVRLAKALSQTAGQTIPVVALLASNPAGDPGSGRDTHRPLSNIPAPPLLFGREKECEKITGTLAGNAHWRAACLIGPRGVGKTALALGVASRLLESGDYHCAVWATAKQTELTAFSIAPMNPTLSTLFDLTRAIGYTFGKPDINSLPPAEQRGTICSLLAQQPTLLVLDNLEEMSRNELAQLALFALTLPAGTKLLTTSICTLGLPGARDCHLEPLDHDNAFHLLAHEAENKGMVLSNEDKERIYSRVGGMPVLMIWAISRMSLEGQTAGSMLGGLANEESDAYEWCFGQAWRALPSDTCRRVLMAAAICRDAASRPFLSTVAQVENEEERDAALGLLSARTSLLAYQQATARFSMLPLTRSLTLHELARRQDSRSFWERALDYYIAYAEQNGGTQRELFDNLEQEQGNLLGIADWCCRSGMWEPLAQLISHLV